MPAAWLGGPGQPRPPTQAVPRPRSCAGARGAGRDPASAARELRVGGSRCGAAHLGRESAPATAVRQLGSVRGGSWVPPEHPSHPRASILPWKITPSCPGASIPPASEHPAHGCRCPTLPRVSQCLSEAKPRAFGSFPGLPPRLWPQEGLPAEPNRAKPSHATPRRCRSWPGSPPCEGAELRGAGLGRLQGSGVVGPTAPCAPIPTGAPGRGLEGPVPPGCEATLSPAPCRGSGTVPAPVGGTRWPGTAAREGEGWARRGGGSLASLALLSLPVPAGWGVPEPMHPRTYCA